MRLVEAREDVLGGCGGTPKAWFEGERWYSHTLGSWGDSCKYVLASGGRVTLEVASFTLTIEYGSGASGLCKGVR